MVKYVMVVINFSLPVILGTKAWDLQQANPNFLFSSKLIKAETTFLIGKKIKHPVSLDRENER